jgi:hypothetical protein
MSAVLLVTLVMGVLVDIALTALLGEVLRRTLRLGRVLCCLSAKCSSVWPGPLSVRLAGGTGGILL